MKIKLLSTCLKARRRAFSVTKLSPEIPYKLPGAGLFKIEGKEIKSSLLRLLFYHIGFRDPVVP